MKERSIMSFKFCPECGYKLDGAYKFCPECGYRLEESAAQAEAPAKSKEVNSVACLEVFEFSALKAGATSKTLDIPAAIAICL